MIISTLFTRPFLAKYELETRKNNNSQNFMWFKVEGREGVMTSFDVAKFGLDLGTNFSK